MATAPVTISQFGGLNPTADPFEVGATGATDLLNVTFDRPNEFRVRDGYTAFATTTVNAYRLHAHASSQLITSGLAKLEVFNTAGAAVAAGTVATAAGLHSMVTYGSPGATATYTAANGDGVRKWSGAAWSVIAAAPAATTFLTISPNDNRLVSVGISTSDKVFFSNAGDAETWPATNWVQLAPGDGEFFTGAASYQGLMFVFKETKFFVFTGNSVDSTGNPVFNYRAVSGVGCLFGAGQSVVSSPHGVYFLARDGVYLTQGGQAVRISTALDSLFWSGGLEELATTQMTLSYHAGRVFLQLHLSSGAWRTYVYYESSQQWTVWSLANIQKNGVFAAYPANTVDTNTQVYFVTGNDSAIYSMSSANTTDNGTAISWSYTSGKYPLDAEQRVAITRESSLFGTGTVTLTLSSDRYADQSGSVTLGTAPTPAEGWLQKDQEGRYFQHALSGTGAATVETLTHNVSTVKPAGIA